MTIRTMPPSRAYDGGWDQTFGTGSANARMWRAFEERAMEQLGGRRCECCRVVVLERRLRDHDHALVCATCVGHKEACRAVPEQAADQEVPGARGGGEAAGGDDGAAAGGDAGAAPAAADGDADGAAAKVDARAAVPVGFTRGTEALTSAVKDCGCGYGPFCPERP